MRKQFYRMRIKRSSVLQVRTTAARLIRAKGWKQLPIRRNFSPSFAQYFHRHKCDYCSCISPSVFERTEFERFCLKFSFMPLSHQTTFKLKLWENEDPNHQLLQNCQKFPRIQWKKLIIQQETKCISVAKAVSFQQVNHLKIPSSNFSRGNVWRTGTISNETFSTQLHVVCHKWIFYPQYHC